MNTAAENLETLEAIFQDRRKDMVKYTFCDLCGISDSHLTEGLCACCRTKYKLESKNEQPKPE